MLIADEVLVLERRRMLRTALDQTAESAALQIVDATNIILIVEPQGVAHQHQVHFLVVLHLNSVDTVDS